MGFILPDIARTEADFEQCRALIKRLEPDGFEGPIGAAGTTTYVIRDEEERSKIHALIHAETAIEVRHMLVDPDYYHKKISFTVLHRGMEMNMRTNGVERYYFTVSANNLDVAQMFTKDGAEIIDRNMIRFMKRL